MNRLVFDVGMFDGGDTAQYLRDGYDVVAVEANPEMVGDARVLFANEIANGRLKIVNAAIAEEGGEREFWICDSLGEWSSFDRSIASRGGAEHHAITVPCRTFGSLIAEFGVPYYAKIDIEGHDRICLQQLTPATAPQFISVEMEHGSGDVDLRLMKALGYTKFKIVCQALDWIDYNPATGILFERYFGGRTGRAVRKLRRIMKHAGLNPRADKYGQGTSGPPGPDTAGTWRSFETVLKQWTRLHETDKRKGAEGLGWWFDIHATK
ncbi:FkbM family methyltransferase [Propylenella binzhouense]|uniref:FkbM family methyltransferase n=1 Tax=Propylenella binzhouense TaxID=2555902 RepID=A0A964WT86_9HYPH|nr:FkbM family methyltransferase [Propylenella binzhouense]MYZ47748.1 FkbM family methyltransferase [Propylenella binzhouense]